MKYALALITSVIFSLHGNGQSINKQKLDSLFIMYMDSGYAGSVLFAKNGKIILKKAYGFANNEFKKPNTTSTLFNVASIGKQFTCFAVLLLEKQGKLKISDYITKYIGAFNDARDSTTIHHVLLHSSGLFKQSVALDYSTRNKFIQSVKDSAMETKPGTAYRYSNAGYTLLAAIVEIVSNQPFEDFLYKNIFQPLKMNNTGYPWETRLNTQLLATGYNSKKMPDPPEQDMFGARGPGNLVTTTGDLFKWVKAINDKRFMPADFKKRIFTDHIPGKETYGWNKAKTSRRTNFYFKGGGRPDFESQLMWYPEDDVVIIFFMNNDYNLRSRIFPKIRSMMN